MNPEERSLLERIYKVTEENNEILRSIRRYSRFGTAIKIFYWVIIIAVSIGSIYFIQPYLNFIKSSLSTGSSNDEGSNSNIGLIKSYTENIQELLR